MVFILLLETGPTNFLTSVSTAADFSAGAWDAPQTETSSKHPIPHITRLINPFLQVTTQQPVVLVSHDLVSQFNIDSERYCFAVTVRCWFETPFLKNCLDGECVHSEGRGFNDCQITRSSIWKHGDV